MTHTASITNQPAWMIGGSASRLGKPPSAIRAIQIRANGQGPNATTIFRTNVLAGGVGRGTGEFRSNADGFNMLRSLTHKGHYSGNIVSVIIVSLLSGGKIFAYVHKILDQYYLYPSLFQQRILLIHPLVQYFPC